MTDSRINAILDEALRLRQAGDLTAALQAVQPLLKITPRKASFAAIIGTLYFEGELWPQAAHWFGVAARLNPDSQRASLGLFHALWELDKRREALTEMARFRAAHHAPEYDTLHRDITEELLEYMAYMNGARTAVTHRKRSSRWRDGRAGINMAALPRGG
jgi:predicted Zn-dependent protease